MMYREYSENIFIIECAVCMTKIAVPTKCILVYFMDSNLSFTHFISSGYIYNFKMLSILHICKYFFSHGCSSFIYSIRNMCSHYKHKVNISISIFLQDLTYLNEFHNTYFMRLGQKI